MEFDLVHGVGIEIEQNPQQKLLRNSLHHENAPVLDGFSFDHPGLNFCQTVLEPLRGLAPLEIKRHLDFLRGPGRGKSRECENGDQEWPETGHRMMTLKKTRPHVNGGEVKSLKKSFAKIQKTDNKRI